MKKKNLLNKLAIVFAFSLLLCCVLPACSSATKTDSGFAGTYEREHTRKHNIAMPHNNGTFRLGPEFLDGKSQMVLNSDGSGTYTFKMDEGFDPTEISDFNKVAGANNLTAADVTNYLSSIDYVIYEGPVTWEEVDGLLYVTGTIPAKDESGETIKLDLQCELKGKTLMNLNGESSGFVKVG